MNAYHPKYWPSWLLVIMLQALGRLPFPILWALGGLLGRLGYLLVGSRRRVARRNLEICFPELSVVARERLVREHFGWLGVAVLTQGLSWGISRARLQRLVRIQNRELIDAHLSAGHPIIILAPHFVAVEMAGMAFSALIQPGLCMYQKIRNPVLEWRVRRARTQFGSTTVERHDDLYRSIRAIRRGAPFFYLPDQDGGRKGLMVPLCGISASTAPMLGRFAMLTKAAVIPAIVRFQSWGRGLELRFEPPLSDFPSGDPAHDATQMNRCIEDAIQTMPAQYFWVHRRFKTRPAGSAPIYPPKRKRNR